MNNQEIEEIFATARPISIRRMFGGKGIYSDGAIIALYLFDEILLKADAETAPEFAAHGARQWTYERPGGKRVAMPYWSVPDSAFDDPDEMAKWVNLACEAGRRAFLGRSAKKGKTVAGEHG
ncbi:TfoX/Sxy family protein [Allorhizobium undicola]|uniref:TfoX/Sxy family protein n=1 Tax=Allorhizobium undicola TaxID=78527 RepID=UPI0004887B7F|nr:TfoX/Sxy family protein [Allorhizobium undicola]